MKKWIGNIQDNYDKYLKEPLRIGFTDTFPIKDIIEEIEVKTNCRRFEVIFKVQYCNVTFGQENEYNCCAIVTDRVDIQSRLPMNGFASHCHIDEARVMENAVVEMAKKHDLMICTKICSWPFAKAIVDDNHFLS